MTAAYPWGYDCHMAEKALEKQQETCDYCASAPCRCEHIELTRDMRKDNQ